MQKLNASEVSELIKNAPGRRGGRSSEYSKLVDELEPGEGFLVRTDDWPKKTPVASYFASRFNKKGQRVIRVVKVNKEEYLVTKL
jgi:hypothetical protein